MHKILTITDLGFSFGVINYVFFNISVSEDDFRT